MKKLLSQILLALLFFSCTKEPGTIKGVITYYFNSNYGDKADVGTQIYFVPENSIPKEKIESVKTMCAAQKDIAELHEVKALISANEVGISVSDSFDMAIHGEIKVVAQFDFFSLKNINIENIIESNVART